MNVIDTRAKWRSPDQLQHELKSALSAAEQNRRPEAADAYPFVLDFAVILNDFAGEQLSFKPLEEAHAGGMFGTERACGASAGESISEAFQVEMFVAGLIQKTGQPV